MTFPPSEKREDVEALSAGVSRSLVLAVKQKFLLVFGLVSLSEARVRWWNRFTLAALMIGVAASFLVANAMWFTFFTSRGYVDYVEGLVLFHQTQAADGLNIYAPSLREKPPYSIPLYGPIFYYAVAGLLGDQPTLLPGRVLSVLSMLGLCGISFWVLLKRAKAEKFVALAGAIPWLVLIGPFQFGANNRVDTLGIFFAGLSVLASTSNRPYAWRWTPLLLLFAGFTKPSAVIAAAPTVFISLWLAGHRGRAVATTVVTALGAITVFWLGDVWSGGNFSRSIVLSNMNPWKWEQMWSLTHYVCRQPMLPLGVVLAVVLCRKRELRPFAIYAVLAFATAVATSGKVGSNTNYFIEVSWIACLCWGFALTVARDYPRAAIVYAIFAALVFQATIRVQPKVGRTASQLSQWNATEKLVTHYAAQGHVLTMEIGALVLNGYQPHLADPHIVARLAEAGEFDDQSIINDLTLRRFNAIIAEKDIQLEYEGHTNWRREIRERVSACYRPVQSDGRLTVYLPHWSSADAIETVGDNL